MELYLLGCLVAGGGVTYMVDGDCGLSSFISSSIFLLGILGGTE